MVFKKPNIMQGKKHVPEKMNKIFFMYVNVKRRFIIKYLNKLFKENNFSVGFP